MNKKIFRSAFFTVLLVLAATIALILGVLYHFFEKQIQTELKNEADFLSQAVEKNEEDFFDGFESDDNRVTLIDAEGNVLYDSRADVESMDNHAQRPEIMEAREQGFGMSVRYSSTLTVKTVNCAVRLSDGRIPAPNVCASLALLTLTSYCEAYAVHRHSHIRFPSG